MSIFGLIKVQSINRAQPLELNLFSASSCSSSSSSPYCYSIFIVYQFYAYFQSEEVSYFDACFYHRLRRRPSTMEGFLCFSVFGFYMHEYIKIFVCVHKSTSESVSIIVIKFGSYPKIYKSLCLFIVDFSYILFCF